MSGTVIIRYLRDLRKHPWLHLSVIVTVATSVFLVSLILFFQSGVTRWVENSRPTAVAFLYLKDGLDSITTSRLRDRVQSLPKVKRVAVKSKQQVWSEVQPWIGTPQEAQLELTPLLPDLMEVEFTSISGSTLEQFRASSALFPEVAEVDIPEDWSRSFLRFERFLFWGGRGMVFLLFLGFIFLASNVILMRHRTRQQQVEFVQLLGGTRWFLLRPVLLESLLEGVVGSLVGLFGLTTLIGLARNALGSNFSIFGIHLFSESLSTSYVAMTFAAGIVTAVSAGLVVTQRMMRSQESR